MMERFVSAGAKLKVQTGWDSSQGSNNLIGMGRR